MKKFFQIVFCLLISVSVFAQEKKDTITKNNKKEYFIGFQLGGGLAWRKNKNINDTLIEYKHDSKGEKAGLAYSFNVYGGVTNNRWNYSMGLEYHHVEYHNNDLPFYYYTNPSPIILDSTLVHFKYSYIH